VIELASAADLIWRLTVDLRRGRSFAEDTEPRPATLAARCCSRLRAMSSWRRDGAFG
jgi:hypothetical protein